MSDIVIFLNDCPYNQALVVVIDQSGCTTICLASITSSPVIIDVPQDVENLIEKFSYKNITFTAI